MHTHIKTTDCTLSGMETRTIDRRIARLERLLPHVDPDLVHLSLVVERHPRRVEFRCSLRVTFWDTLLAATRQRSTVVRGLLTEAFDAVEGQLGRVREIRADRRTRGVRAAEAKIRA